MNSTLLEYRHTQRYYRRLEELGVDVGIAKSIDGVVRDEAMDDEKFMVNQFIKYSIITINIGLISFLALSYLVFHSSSDQSNAQQQNSIQQTHEIRSLDSKLK